MNPIKYEDLVKPDESINNAISQLEQLMKGYESALEKVKNGAIVLKTSVEGVTSVTSEGRTKIKGMASDTEILTRAATQETEALRAASLEIVRLREARTKYTAAIKAEVQMSNASVNIKKLDIDLTDEQSYNYNKLAAQYALNKIELNNMTAAQQRHTEEGKALVKTTKDIYEEMHRLQSETGKNALKVGSYNEAVDRLKDSFGDWKSKLIETGGNTAKLSALMSEATSAVMGLASACWAFVATPIGAVIAVIVVAVVALVAIFSKAIDVAKGNEEQSAKLAKAMAVLKVALAVVTKYFEGLAEVIIDTISVMADVIAVILKYSGVVGELGKKTQELMQNEKDRVKLLKAIREANEQNAKDEGLIAELRTKNAEKEKYIYKQRIGFLDEAIAKERDIAERNVAVAKEKLRIMEVDYSLVKKSTEQENALSEARIAVIDATTKMNIQTREMAEGRSEAINQMNTDRKAALDEAQKMDDEEIKRRRDAQDLITSLMVEGQAKQIAINKQAFDRKAQDLDREIQKSEEARISEEKFYEELNIKSFRKELHLTKEQIKEMQIAKGDFLLKASDEELKIRRASELDKLALQKWQLETNLENVIKYSEDEKNTRLKLIKNQMDAEILLNASKTKESKANESDIRAKYNSLIIRAEQDFEYEVGLRKFDIAQAFAQSEFDLLRNSERAKTEFKLTSERDRLQKLLDLDKNASDKMTEQQRKTIENQIKLYNREIGKVAKKKDIYELLGIKLNDDEKKAIADSVNYALSAFQSILSANVELADMAVQKANERVAASQTAVEKEIEARNNGYANNLELAQKELDRNKKDQAEALALKKQAAKDQQMLDTAMQASSLITATAQIWAALSGVGPLGWVLALAAVGTMWGSFAAAKIKANEVTNKTTYGKGGYEFLRGGSHASGNDIPMGTMSDGSQRTAEGGEFFAIINKKSTNKYRGVLPDLVDSLNRGVFESKYASMFSGADKHSSNVVVNVNSNTSKLEREVGLIRQATESRKQIYHAPDGSVVETYKNLKRVIYVQSPN